MLLNGSGRAEIWTVAGIPQRKNGSQTVFIPSAGKRADGGAGWRVADARRRPVARVLRCIIHYAYWMRRERRGGRAKKDSIRVRRGCVWVCGCVCVTLFSSYRRWRCCGTRLTQNIVLSGRPSYRRRWGGVREDDISFRPPTPPDARPTEKW